MAFLLSALVVVSVAGLAVALWIQMQEASRREVVERTLGTSPDAGIRRAIVRSTTATRADSLKKRMLQHAPTAWAKNKTVQQRLVQAGFDGSTAPLTYSGLRVVSLAAFPLLAFLFMPKTSFLQVVVGIASAAFVGLVLPTFVLYRLVGRRQNRIRRGLPDALDLLVVCVEAGISLDAAILRVGKDLIYVHSDLAGELVLVNRKTNAGMTREEALRGLWDRTGVEEVRTLVASMVQSEKWGSSAARVLRVSAETLRRKRRHAAEKKAATAPLKMVVPMALFIFPALFVVILGPALLQMLKGFGGK